MKVLPIRERWERDDPATQTTTTWDVDDRPMLSIHRDDLVILLMQAGYMPTRESTR